MALIDPRPQPRGFQVIHRSANVKEWELPNNVADPDPHEFTFKLLPGSDFGMRIRLKAEIHYDQRSFQRQLRMNGKSILNENKLKDLC